MKKILLSLGALGAVIAPAIAMTSCGKSEDPINGCLTNDSFNSITECVDKGVKVEHKNKDGKPALWGSTAFITYAGYLNGQLFKGGNNLHGNPYGLHLDKQGGGFIPGFTYAVYGHRVGERITFHLTFPVDYQSKELAGKTVEWKILIQAVTE